MRIKRKSQQQLDLEKSFRTGERKARSMIMRIIRDINSVDDVLQNTYMKAWKNIAKFKGGCALDTWVCAIARNEALIHLKKKRRHAVHMESLSLKAKLDHHMIDEPLYDLIASNLEMVVNDIPSDLLRIVLKKRMLGYSEREVAAQLGIPEGTAKSRYRRAKEQITIHSKENT
jgi:RNA polymerase sigma-70 factor (ECF subfamily)